MLSNPYLKPKCAIEKKLKFLYNTMMIRKTTLLTALMMIIIPQSASAYFSPEDVLLNRDMFLPPSAREAQERNSLQSEESAARREREQDRAFALQHPVVEIAEPLQAAAPAAPIIPAGYMAVPINGALYGQQLFGTAPAQQSGTLDAANLELLRTMRLLGRVNQNQNQNMLLHAQSLGGLHSGAPLPPTGAGTVVSIMTLMGVALYIFRRSRSATAVVRV